MAWIVYDAMPGRTTGKTTVFGPLPMKRWVKMPGEKRPRKVKAQKPGPQRSADDALTINARHAIEYARWLAARDLKTIPKAVTEIDRYRHPRGATPRFKVEDYDAPGAALWRWLDIPGGKRERRFHSVVFKGTETLEIDIPHWDFIPADPVETIELHADDFFAVAV
jgi:hypothetical protein